MAIIASVLLALPALGCGARADPSTSTSPSALASRFPEWRAACEGDGCLVPTLASLSVETPADEETVDIAAEATFDYRTTPGDAGVARLSLREAGVTPWEPLSFEPLRSELPTAEASTATTLGWRLQDVPAAGRTYVAYLWLHATETSGNGTSEVTGQGGELNVWIESAKAMSSST